MHRISANPPTGVLVNVPESNVAPIMLTASPFVRAFGGKHLDIGVPPPGFGGPETAGPAEGFGLITQRFEGPGPVPAPPGKLDDKRLMKVFHANVTFGRHVSPFDIGSLLGLRPRVVAITPELHAFIAPDLRQVDAMLRIVGWSFLIALALTLLAAWGIGRWITDQAVAPLVTLARELRRFAAGDFTPRRVMAFDRSEVGALVDAYNGAAAQVAAAFREQSRVEKHMRRYLGEAGHEMRTPLTVISGYLDVLERGGWDEPELRQQALPMMRAETRRLRALVERLMTLARLEGDGRSDAQIVDIVEVARDVIAEVTAARGGTVRLHAEGDHVVFAEPVEVYEAIVNLVDNARKYGAGSPVDVSVCDENGTTLRVTDHGPGIAEADRARLFERFFRGESANGIEGSGLGLAIVARAAERSHATVALESTTSGNTTFRLWFPPVNVPEHDRSVIVLA